MENWRATSDQEESQSRANMPNWRQTRGGKPQASVLILFSVIETLVYKKLVKLCWLLFSSRDCCAAVKDGFWLYVCCTGMVSTSISTLLERIDYQFMWAKCRIMRAELQEKESRNVFRYHCPGAMTLAVKLPHHNRTRTPLTFTDGWSQKQSAHLGENIFLLNLEQ